jgi:hypothetical protein
MREMSGRTLHNRLLFLCSDLTFSNFPFTHSHIVLPCACIVSLPYTSSNAATNFESIREIILFVIVPQNDAPPLASYGHCFKRSHKTYAGGVVVRLLRQAPIVLERYKDCPPPRSWPHLVVSNLPQMLLILGCFL